MRTVWSGLSLLMMLGIVGLLIFLSRRSTRPGSRHGAHGGPRLVGKSGSYTTLGYAFSWTLGALLFLISGLIGYRLGRRDFSLAGTRWSNDFIWEQILIGLVMACAAAWFWRKGLREIHSNVYVPELAGRDTAAPPSRRIERR